MIRGALYRINQLQIISFLWVIIWAAPPPFLTFKKSFCPCAVRKVSLTSRRWNMWSFISHLGRAQLLSCFSSWSICVQGTASGYSDWVLSTSYLNRKYLFIVASNISSILEMKNRKLFLRPPPTPWNALGVTCWFSWSQVLKLAFSILSA